MRFAPLPLLALLLASGVAHARQNAFAASFQKLAKAEALVTASASQPVLKQAEVLGGLGLAALQVMDGEKAAGYFQLALTKIGPSAPTNLGARQKLLALLLRSQRLAGMWMAAAKVAADLQTLYASQNATQTEAWREVTLERWRMLQLAGATQQASQVSANLRRQAANSQWVRRLDLETRRKTPAVPVPLSYSGSAFAEESGRLVTGIYPDAEPFVEGRAKIKVGLGYGLLDERLRLRVPPRYTDLRQVQGSPDRFRGKIPVAENQSRYGMIDRDGAIVIPFEFQTMTTGECGVVEVTRPSEKASTRANRTRIANKIGEEKAKELDGGKAWFRITDGEAVGKEDFMAALREWEVTEGSYAPFRYQVREKKVILADRDGRQAFPPLPVPEPFAKGYRLLRVDGDLVVCNQTRGKGSSSKRVFLLWNWKTGKLVLPASEEVTALGRFQRNGKAVAYKGKKYGLLRRNGTWALPPRWNGLHSVNPVNERYALARRAIRTLHDLDGNEISTQKLLRLSEGLPSLMPARLGVAIPDQGLGRNASWRPNLLDAEARPLWPDGRLRMVDNQLSLLLPEDWQPMRFDLGQMSLKISPVMRGYGSGHYSHQAEVHAMVVDRLPGEEAPQVAARLLTRLMQGAKNLKHNALTTGPVRGRNWLVWELSHPKVSLQADGYGFGAVTLGTHQAYSVILWGLHARGKTKAPERTQLRKRFDNLLQSVRFPGQKGF